MYFKSSPQDGQLVRFPGEGVASGHLLKNITVIIMKIGERHPHHHHVLLLTMIIHMIVTIPFLLTISESSVM